MGEDGGGASDLYSQAVAIVMRDRKASTSYIQRRLQIGYNRAATLMERMEQEGIVGQANHAGKREILVDEGDHAGIDATRPGRDHQPSLTMRAAKSPQRAARARHVGAGPVARRLRNA